jgi:hypothetical protein
MVFITYNQDSCFITGNSMEQRVGGSTTMLRNFIKLQL